MSRQIHHSRPALRLPTAGSSLVQLACAGLLGLAACLPAQAALFGDDEARKAIIELRQKVDANKQAADAAAAEAREGDASTRRSLLELSNQIEQLRAELARLISYLCPERRAA